MKRSAAILVALIATAAILATGTGAGGDDGAYEVRAIFDNAAFLVTGEEVRVAGATVGTVAEVDISGVDEPVREDGSPDPGKAVVVLHIDDPAFQDFREDASCRIRPQSLIGEKFVACEPTQPRAAGTEPPPELATISDDEPGAGQHLLPLERNGTAVDLDLVNNIMEEPYPDRFRLILNSLGASLAARGDELAEIIERANPALQETNEVLAILARQNRQLSQLAVDSDRVLGALARKRTNIASFINQSDAVAAATAERSAELETSLQKFPGFLRELRSTMNRLDAFSTTATPVFSDLGDAAPALTRASKALGPFSDAGTTALTSLGKAADAAGPDLVAADPVIKQVRGLARSAEPAAKNLARTLSTFRKTGGIGYLMDFIFNSTGSINIFDSYGHYLRSYLPLNNCVDYETVPEVACLANFNLQNGGTAAKARRKVRSDERNTDERRARDGRPEAATSARNGDHGSVDAQGSPTAPSEPSTEAAPDTTTPAPGTGEPGVEAAPNSAGSSAAPSPDASESAESLGAARKLLDFLIGRPDRHKRGKR